MRHESGLVNDQTLATRVLVNNSVFNGLRLQIQLDFSTLSKRNCEEQSTKSGRSSVLTPTDHTAPIGWREHQVSA
jgi:hypothetical protein